MTVYVYMHKRTNRQTLTSEQEAAGPYWSLWRRRRFPAGSLDTGDRVLLLDHWRGDDRFSWQVTAATVEYQTVESKADAIEHIARVFGLPEETVACDPYIGQKDDVRSVLLAWDAVPVERLNLPRPPGLRIGRDGWARLTEQEAHDTLVAARELAEAEEEALGLKPAKRGADVVSIGSYRTAASGS